jgi:hypothetical protein
MLLYIYYKLNKKGIFNIFITLHSYNHYGGKTLLLNSPIKFPGG